MNYYWGDRAGNIFVQDCFHLLSIKKHAGDQTATTLQGQGLNLTWRLQFSIDFQKHSWPQWDNSTWTWPVSMERGGKKSPKHTKPFPGRHKALKLEPVVAQDVVMNQEASAPRSNSGLTHRTLQTFSAFPSTHDEHAPSRARFPLLARSFKTRYLILRGTQSPKYQWNK